MLARVIAVACCVAFAGAGVAFAQADGPAEQPDATYQGESYVDSKGCMFLKAGYGGAATWVPRVGQDRKPICGQSPTLAVAKVADTAAPAHKVKAKKRAVRAVAPRAPVMISCPESVPVARRYATTDGGSVVICTAVNGSLTGARSPIYPPGSGVGAALSSTRYPGVDIPLPEVHVAAVAPIARAKPLLATSAMPISPAAAVLYVQVGTYGEPANADGARARILALGLPVANGKFSKNGKALQVIYAGPFASGMDAQAALHAALGVGFSDAYIP